MNKLNQIQSQQRVVLAWSALDMELHDRDDVVIIPISLDGYSATQKGTLGRVIETETWLGGFGEIGMEIMSRVRLAEARIINLKQPWIASYAGMEFPTSVFCVLLWDVLLSGICKTMSPLPVLLIPPSAFINSKMLRPGSWDEMEMKAFWICALALERKGKIKIDRQQCQNNHKYRNEGLRYTRRKAVASVGCFLSVIAPWLLFRRTQSSPPRRGERTKILLAGVQWGDGLHQAPLAEHLYRRYGSAFRWVSMIRDSPTSGMTTEERSLLSAAPHRHVYWEDSDHVNMPRWIHPAFKKLTDRYCMWKVAGILARTLPTSLSRADWSDWLGGCKYHDLLSNYQRWSRYLKKVKPRIIVANSTLQEMAYIRAWARKKSVPYILFPHGIFPKIESQFHVDGDYVGVFGPLMVDQVRNADIPGVRHVVSCGAMQFDAKNASLSLKSSAGSCMCDRTVLYLTSFSFVLYPASPQVIYKEVETLVKACNESNCRLIIREHPRGGKGQYRAAVDMLDHKYPGTVSISSEPSIVKDIAAATLVVASHFDGALIDALYYGKPVIVYISDDGHNDSPDLIERTGCRVRTFEELMQAMQSACMSRPWVEGKIAEQRAFLSKYMGCGNVDDDPWIKAEQLIGEALNNASE